MVCIANKNRMIVVKESYSEVIDKITDSKQIDTIKEVKFVEFTELVGGDEIRKITCNVDYIIEVIDK